MRSRYKTLADLSEFAVVAGWLILLATIACSALYLIWLGLTWLLGGSPIYLKGLDFGAFLMAFVAGGTVVVLGLRSLSHFAKLETGNE